jgi:MSHA pilin protein MshA
MAHGKYLVNTGAPLPSLVVEGTTINFQTTKVTGYPKAETNLATAAGLSADDYTVYGPNHANDANSTSTLADEIMIVPNSVAKTPSGLKCYVKYKEAANKGEAPTITIGATSATDCE